MAISLIFISISLQNIFKGYETESWSSTTGIILSSDVDSHYDSESSTTYGAEITYQYDINGINYTSNLISYGYSYSSDSSAAYRLADDYPVGKVVAIYYNPNNPSEAVLIKGIDISSWIFFAFGFIFFLIGLGLLIYFIISGRSEKASDQLKIILEKNDYTPGETISGTVNLDLKKQVLAKSLKIAFVAEKLIDQRDSNGQHQRIYPLHKSEFVLDAEKEYFNQSYNFQLKIPLDILQKALKWGEDGLAYFGNKQVQMGERTIAMQKKAKKIIEWGQSMGLLRMMETDVWYVEAHLEIPKKIDIRNRIDINIS